MAETKQVLSTWLEPELAAAVEHEADQRMVSKAAVMRWALMERYPDVVAEMRKDNGKDTTNGKA